MSQGPLCPNLSQKVQKKVSQMANRNLPIAMLLGGLSVNLNHLIMNDVAFVPINMIKTNRKQFKVYFIHVRAYAITRCYDEVVTRVIDFTL